MLKIFNSGKAQRRAIYAEFRDKLIYENGKKTNAISWAYRFITNFIYYLRSV